MSPASPLLIELRKAVEAIERGGPKAARDAITNLRSVRNIAPRNVEAMLDQYAIALIAAVDKCDWYRMTMLIRDNGTLIEEASGCIHRFAVLDNEAKCTNCGEPALPLLITEVHRLDGACRAAVGHLVLGSASKAEALLREAALATPMIGHEDDEQLGLFARDARGTNGSDRA